jgi:hypothetical protein
MCKTEHDGAYGAHVTHALGRRPYATLAESAQAIAQVKRAASFLQLPAQERIGHVVNDIPCIRSVARARIGDSDYVPACT